MYWSDHPLAAAVLALPVCGSACVVDAPDPVRLKQMMAGEIAFRLGLHPRQVPLNAITSPELHTPVRLGRACEGIESSYYSAAFRITMPHSAPEYAATPLRWPRLAREPPEPGISKRRSSSMGAGGAGRPGRWTSTDGWPGRWRAPTHCAYEGVAVIMGQGSGPVKVNFERRCW